MHVRQTVCCSVSWYLPTSHREHADALWASEKVPAAHGVIAMDPAGLYEPAPHASQSDWAVFFDVLE